MTDLNSVVRAVSGIAIAYGPTDPRTQKVVLAHCQRGGAEVMREVLGEVMIDTAITEKRVPYPVGIKTKELIDQVQKALVVICKEYLNNGGVLVARKYIRLEDLYATLLKFWHARFMKPLKEHPTVIDGLPQAEVLARLAISAQAARTIVFTQLKKKIIDGKVCFVIEDSYLEPFCMAVANATYEGFHRPDRMVHNMIHNTDPDVGPGFDVEKT